MSEEVAHAVTRLLGQLVALPSMFPPGATTAICAHIADLLRAAGYVVAIHARADGPANVVAKIGQGHPVLAFNCHIDTVAPGPGWSTDPLTLTPVGSDRYAGLGAVNCKGSAATHLWLAQTIAREGGPARGTLMFTFVGDEERLGPDGTQFLVEAGHFKPDMLVMAAPTSNRLMVEERGVLWARLQTTGRAAHAGDPSAGDNAILRLVRLLTHLDAHMKPCLAGRVQGAHHSTLSFGTISGGTNTNVVPQHCEATLDRRFLPGSETVESAMRELAGVLSMANEPADTWQLDLITGTNGFCMSADQPLVSAFGASVARVTGSAAEFRVPVGASDARFLADSGAQIVIFGPGDDHEGHAANEAVDEAALAAACAIQRDVVHSLLGVAR